jgi:methylmalonyl-CoA mutase N-terminal domain/subunit
VLRAAVALFRVTERRAPEIASSKWWKGERHGDPLDTTRTLEPAPRVRFTQCFPFLMREYRHRFAGARCPTRSRSMPYIVDAVRAYPTVGEICEALGQVYGTYTEVNIT